jgi:hypothetical protein
MGNQKINYQGKKWKDIHVAENSIFSHLIKV